MRGICCILIGYLLGALNPAHFLSKRKGVDLRKEGTGNLGTTNTMLVMGKAHAILVLLLDMGKAFLSAKIAKWLFPKLMVAGLLAALGAILGHIYPYHMHFQGGKGLACFGGMILEYNPVVFAILLVIGVFLVLVVNYGVALPVSAAILFPIAAAVTSRKLSVFLVSLCASTVILYAHRENVQWALRGEDIRVREYLRGGKEKN
ncbi:MAG: glycerol-3-phosphate acyltransferase [Oscillospiraceae bacterium]|nr:glycerol-3-phosphate acyltransferase [Oscillospiraceae bacterium]